MNTCAVIAEYNPFHNGHLHQLKTIKEQLDCDNIIVIMSGNFTQRGIPSICDKAARTKIALEYGASLVIELPVVFATASAELFAKGAIKILNSLNCVDYLVYGIENYENNTFIKDAAKIMIQNEQVYNAYLKQYKQQGLSYPAACEAAFTALSKNVLTDFQYNGHQNNKSVHNNQQCDEFRYNGHHFEDLFLPNNVLALEYEKALLTSASTIKSFAIKRKGNGYSSSLLDNSFVSASAIRNGILNNTAGIDDLHDYMPSFAADVISDIYKENRLIFIDDFKEMVLLKLMELSDESTDILDLSEDLLNKFRNNLNSYKSVTQFVGEIKTKDYTYNRIMRTLCHILLDIKETDITSALSPDNKIYTRILGFNTHNASLLSTIKQNSDSVIITNVKAGEKTISKDALHLFEKDIFASNVYNSVCRIKSACDVKNEYQYQIIKFC